MSMPAAKGPAFKLPIVVPFRYCTPDICRYDRSYYMYRIDLAPNVLFLIIFSLSLVGFLGVYIKTRRALSFTLAMCLGLICEVLGYAGRIMSWENQWDEDGFLVQIICLTIGPAFLAAGIYFCLQRIVCIFGPENSRLKPKQYPMIFIPCDGISLMLQAVGGALASIASHTGDDKAPGSNIMMTGLGFQVTTIAVFMALTADFALRTHRRVQEVGDGAALNQNPAVVKIRNSFKFRACLVALAVATLAILWRSTFRVVELSGGWTGELMAEQGLYYGMEGTMISVACLALNIFHPAVCFGEMMDGPAKDGKGGAISTAAVTHDTNPLMRAEPGDLEKNGDITIEMK
ncbi:RTA1 like protein-domain-containing protein [Apiospora kogelbergensis]|uniref:RTA1 like protein-domain-containing protein n=1 Tax=Apiospora kogelbergensis TaxID=1337665 RepID=UPI00312D7668